MNVIDGVVKRRDDDKAGNDCGRRERRANADYKFVGEHSCRCQWWVRVRPDNVLLA